MSMRGPRPMLSRHPGPYGQPGPARPAGLGARPTGIGARPIGIGARPSVPGMMRPPGQLRHPGVPGQQRMPIHMAPHAARPMGPRTLGPRPPIVSSNTNDPAGAHCRVFVGNLNTMAMTKEDIEAIFAQYGPVVGISVHKGYAFVQYGNNQQARRASTEQDGKTYAGQTLDCNIASEPKKAVAKKRPAPVQSVGSQGPTTAPVPAKMARPAEPYVNPGSKNLVPVGYKPGVTPSASTSTTAPSITFTRPMKKSTISTGNDVLICGTCKSLFNNLSNFIQHKKQKCELKVIVLANQEHVKGETRELLCAVCDVQFTSAWDLCQHCQDEHSIAIFKDAGMVDGLNGDN